jgi:hypothetical protein
VQLFCHANSAESATIAPVHSASIGLILPLFSIRGSETQSTFGKKEKRMGGGGTVLKNRELGENIGERKVETEKRQVATLSAMQEKRKLESI